jgi:hypothetical protein
VALGEEHASGAPRYSHAKEMMQMPKILHRKLCCKRTHNAIEKSPRRCSQYYIIDINKYAISEPCRKMKGEVSDFASRSPIERMKEANRLYQSSGCLFQAMEGLIKVAYIIGLR